MTLGLPEPVDPAHAPLPSTMSERLLFRLLYETLVWVDCSGRVHPGLAQSWRAEADNRVWIFTLRDAATFWNGDETTPLDVVTSWRGRTAARARVPIDSVTVVGDHQIRIGLSASQASPALFAHPALAVTKPAATSAWPSGTTPFDVILHDAVATGVVRIHLREESRSLVEFDAIPAADARDFLDQSVDLVVTNASTALDYAATRASVFTSIPLPWNRTYVVLVPERVRSLSRPVPSRQLLNDIARDAVRVEAQAAAAPFWWESVSACGWSRPAPSGRVVGEGATRLVYDRGDAPARDVAERLVALARSPGGQSSLGFLGPRWSVGTADVKALGLGPDEFSESVRRGAEAGYVLVFPRFVVDRCSGLRELIASIPWLAPQTEGRGTDFSVAVVPLVDVRARAVFRHGRIAASTDWDGMLRLNIR